MLGLSLLISAGIGLATGAISGYAKQEQANNQRDLNNDRIAQINLNSEQTRYNNVMNALSASSAYELTKQTTKDNIGSMIDGYNSQLDSYANQAERSVGSYRAGMATTGFRNSGSNMNALTNAQYDARSSMNQMYNNIRQTLVSNGASNMTAFSNYSNNMAGYRTAIAQNLASNQMQIDYINKQSKQLGYDGEKFLGLTVDAWKDAGLSAVESAGSYYSGQLAKGGDAWKWEGWK